MIYNFNIIIYTLNRPVYEKYQKLAQICDDCISVDIKDIRCIIS